MKGKRPILILLSTFVVGFIFWILCAPVLASLLIVDKPLAKADAILVLSGSSTYKERARKAAMVYNEGEYETVILTNDGGQAGWSQEERRNPPFVELSKRELVSNGVPDEKIQVLKRQVTGTIYEARIIKEHQPISKWNSILIVTSPYHSRRAHWVFQRELRKDIEIGVVTPQPGDQTPSIYTWWLSRRGWRNVAGEYVKFVVYWLFY